MKTAEEKLATARSRCDILRRDVKFFRDKVEDLEKKIKEGNTLTPSQKELDSALELYLKTH